MGSRTIPFEVDLECDLCGKKGAYDFMGDALCEECATKVIRSDASKPDEDMWLNE